MRDIRDDLRERLKILDVRLAEETERYSAVRRELEADHMHKLEVIKAQSDAIITLLNAENESNGFPIEPVQSLPGMRLPLKDYFLTLTYTRGPLTKDDLRDAANRAGYFDDDASAGRVTHATIMNLVSSGRLVRLSDGGYAKPESLTAPSADSKRVADQNEFSPGEESP